MATFPCKKQMHSLEPVPTGTFSLHGSRTNGFSYKPSHDRVSAVWKFACKTTPIYIQITLKCSLKSMPQNNPWSCPVRYHMISHRESVEQFGKSSEKTMIILWGKKSQKKKIRMYKKNLTLARFEPRLP